MPADRPQISVAQMVQDPRLVRLFAHVGELIRAWNDGTDEDHALEALADDLLLLAPEYHPPDESHGALEDEWQRLTTEATPEDRVVDLMAALEASVAEAKAARSDPPAELIEAVTPWVRRDDRRAVLAAIPDGWAKVGGEWVRLRASTWSWQSTPGWCNHGSWEHCPLDHDSTEPFYRPVQEPS